MAAAAAGGCAVGTEPIAHTSEPIVYGVDDRVEYYQVAPALQSATADSMVALVAKASIQGLERGTLPSLGAVDGLCPGERFAAQPVAAFCTGVLVDWDLVLTAGHCASLFAIGEFEAVFGYYYDAPGVLDVLPTDVREPVEIVGWELDPEGADPRLDYAWLRLASPVTPPRQPVPIYVRAPPVVPGESVVSIAAGGGNPMKIDADARVRDVRAVSSDYFIADTDTSAGASGGAALDTSGALLGILARGGTDYVATDAGCSATNRVPDGGAAQEQYTYAYRAVEGLCSGGTSVSSICRKDCSDPCEALPAPTSVREAGGCHVAPAAPGRPSLGFWASVTALCLGLRVRRSRRRARSRNQREYF